MTTRKATGSLPEKRQTDTEIAPPIAVKKRAKSAKSETAPKKTRITKKKRAVTKTTGTSTQHLTEEQPSPEVTPSGANCPLLSLPAELRNEIFSLVFGESTTVAVAPIRPHIKEPALAAVNRQIRSETLPMWYEGRFFEINGSSPAVRILRSLREDQLRLIRHVLIITKENVSLDYIRERLTHLMRDAEPRGLSKDALHFRDVDSIWRNLREVRQLLRTAAAPVG